MSSDFSAHSGAGDHYAISGVCYLRGQSGEGACSDVFVRGRRGGFGLGARVAARLAGAGRGAAGEGAAAVRRAARGRAAGGRAARQQHQAGGRGLPVPLEDISYW